MIIAAKTNEERTPLLMFLRKHGLDIPMSEDFQAIGHVIDGALRAVVGYNTFCGRTCAMHVAGEGSWMTREFIRVAFDYPFNQFGAVKVFTAASQENKRSMELQRRLGFKVMQVVPGGWNENAALVLQAMSKKECHWLETKNARQDLKAA